PKPENLESLIKYGLAVQHFCDHLVATNLEDHLHNPAILGELVEKLPASRRLEWARFKHHLPHVGLQEFGEFMDELMEHACEVCNYVPQNHPHPHPRYRTHHHTNTSDNEMASTAAHQRRVKPCAACSSVEHHIRNCQEFRRMSVTNRLDLVGRHGLCKLCLNQHGIRRCLSRFRCDVNGCEARHNALLHLPAARQRADVLTHSSATKVGVLFRIVPVVVHHGSSVTLMEGSLANTLGVRGSSEPLQLGLTADITRSENGSQRIDVQISARGSDRRYELSGARTVQKLSLPSQELNYPFLINNFPQFQKLPIQSFLKAEPKLLIGLQHMELMTPLETRTGRADEPIAVRSPLGWAVYGPYNYNAASILTHHNDPLRAAEDEDSDEDLNTLLRDYFTLEEVGVTHSAFQESNEIVRAKKLLENTTRRHGERFETGLLWNTDNVILPDSYPMAVKRTLTWASHTRLQKKN
uniref:Peptidase aspartic putative domain-containing protein n=1 Tax=Anopheles epiroticus TaxID=199890 RepID=A0A182PWW1_9DIPT